MRVLVDTCVIIDALQSCVPFAEVTQKILLIDIDLRLMAGVLPLVEANLYYIARKYGKCENFYQER